MSKREQINVVLPPNWMEFFDQEAKMQDRNRTNFAKHLIMQALRDIKRKKELRR